MHRWESIKEPERNHPSRQSRPMSEVLFNNQPKGRIEELSYSDHLQLL